MSILISFISVALVFLVAAAAGIYLVYLISGKDEGIIRTLILMHVFAFLVILAATTIQFLSPDLKAGSQYLMRAALVIVVLVQSFWLYFKERPFSLQATFGVVLLMNIVEVIVISATSFFLFKLLR